MSIARPKLAHVNRDAISHLTRVERFHLLNKLDFVKVQHIVTVIKANTVKSEAVIEYKIQASFAWQGSDGHGQVVHIAEVPSRFPQARWCR